MDTNNGDLHTVLRHLVENTQWGGNHSGKQEANEALDRFTSNDYGNPDNDAPDTPDAPDSPHAPARTTDAKTPSKATGPTTRR